VLSKDVPGIEELSGSLLVEVPSENGARPIVARPLVATTVITNSAPPPLPKPPLSREPSSPTKRPPSAKDPTERPRIAELASGAATVSPDDAGGAPQAGPATPDAIATSDLESIHPPRSGIAPIIEAIFETLRTNARAFWALCTKIAHHPSRQKLGTLLKSWGSTAGRAQQLRWRLPSSSVLRSEARPRWFVPAAAVFGLLVGFGMLGLLVRLVHKGGDEAAALHSGRDTLAAPSSAANAAAATPAPSEGAAVPALAPAPKGEPAAPSQASCAVAGSPHVVAPNAMLPVGVEVARVGEGIAVGFAPGPNEGMAVRLDGSSLAASDSVRVHSDDPAKRAVPIKNAKNELSLVVDSDAPGDPIQGRRTVATDPPVQLGVANGHVVWSAMPGPTSGELWPVDGGAVEALRGAVDPSGQHGIAVAFRQSGTIVLGAATGAAPLAARGELARIRGLGPAVGSPAVAMNGEVVFVAWADRVSSDDPWELRWVRFRSGEAPGTPSLFSPPPGGPGEQVMSPGLTALSGGRFLLVWTEGPASAHQVRALTLSSEGAALGAPFVVSGDGMNAGQGQAAVSANGQGIIAFLESRGQRFEIAAAPIACGM
jgi:hypothetical protein